MLPRIVRVQAEPESLTILATFDTGEQRRFHVEPLMSRGVFQHLREPQAFVAVATDEMGGVVWESGPDLSRDTIYLGGEPA